MVVDYINPLEDKGIEARINSPTRVERRGDKIVLSCIDHVNARSEHNELVSFITEQKESDHFFVGFRVFPDSNISVAYAHKPRSVVITDKGQVDLAVANFDWNLFLASTFPGNLNHCFVAHITAIMGASKRVVLLKQMKMDCP